MRRPARLTTTMEEDEPSFEARGSSYIGTRVFGTIQTDCSRKALTKLEVATGPGRTVAIRILPGIPITSNMTRRLPTEIDVDIPDHNTRGMAQVTSAQSSADCASLTALIAQRFHRLGTCRTADFDVVEQLGLLAWESSRCTPRQRHRPCRQRDEAHRHPQQSVRHSDDNGEPDRAGCQTRSAPELEEGSVRQ